MNNKAQIKLVNALNQEFGYLGAKVITTTDATTPSTGFEFIAVQALSDAVVSASTGATDAQDAIDLSALSYIGAGSIVYGRWVSITLSSGEVVAYQGKAQTVVD